MKEMIHKFWDAGTHYKCEVCGYEISKTQMFACWDVRELYFECLDKIAEREGVKCGRETDRQG
jgi:hypothetical protein